MSPTSILKSRGVVNNKIEYIKVYFGNNICEGRDIL